MDRTLTVGQHVILMQGDGVERDALVQDILAYPTNTFPAINYVVVNADGLIDKGIAVAHQDDAEPGAGRWRLAHEHRAGVDPEATAAASER